MIGKKYFITPRFVYYLTPSPEYLIHFPTLVKICEENGLELLLLKSFHDYFEEKYKSGLELLERMRVFDKDGNFPKDQWEACGVYSVFAFRKL
jgi:mRNA (guanine-N7-)-methyltransferase